MIRLENLTKLYGSFVAVDDISLHVPRGVLYGCLGPNGAGKTTTLRMIAGILRPSQGRVLLGGDDVHANPLSAKMRLGFIPDRPFVYDKLTGAEFLRFVAGLYGQEGDTVERRIAELLEVFELTSWKDELVEAYSHGMRQKLMIAAALVHDPDVVIADEPTSRLDAVTTLEIGALFAELAHETGTTVVCATHDPLLIGLADRELRLNRVGGLRPGALGLGRAGRLSPAAGAAPPRAGSFGVYLERRWHLLELAPASVDRADPLRSLDVWLLGERVLGPVLGITDQGTDVRLAFVGGIRGIRALEVRVDAGEAALAVSMFPTSMEQLMAVADAGAIMPPKSTWFEPKLRDGLLIHVI